MSTPLLSLLLFLGLLVALIVITEILHRVGKWPVEQSRKFLHVSGGLMCLLLPSFFTSHWWILILTSLSFLLLLFTYVRKMLDSIHKTNRRSVGSVLFPIPVYGCFLLAELMDNGLLFYLPVSLLTIADTVAETAGNRWGAGGTNFFNGQKTMAGTLGFFFTAIPVCIGWLYAYDYPMATIVLLSLAISSATAITELVTLRGWDNLTVPLVADIILVLWLVK